MVKSVKKLDLSLIEKKMQSLWPLMEHSLQELTLRTYITSSLHLLARVEYAIYRVLVGSCVKVRIKLRPSYTISQMTFLSKVKKIIH